jgi:hypothetical protein
MSKLDEVVGKALSDLDKMGVDSPDVDLLRKVAKGLGPSAYGGDGETVACSDKSELERIQRNYLQKKLGLSAEEATMDSIAAVCAQMKEIRRKRRTTFYYLLCKHHGKEAVYEG